MSNDMNRYFDEFGRDLKQADASANAPDPRRTWARLAVVGGVAGVVVALVVALAPGDGGLSVPNAQADAVRQARKALLVENSILHSHVTNKVVNLDGTGGRGTATSFEVWRTMRPVRYREIFSELVNGTVTSSQESSWARGVLTDYDPQAKTMRRLIGGGASDPNAAPLSPAGENPVAALRKVLATGQFKDTGLHELDGRQVRRLVGIVEVRGERARTKAHPEPRSFVTKEQVEYDVDPQTFTPVQMRQLEGVPGTPGFEPYMAVWDFKEFEWLPITKKNLELLTIHPAAGTKVTTQTLKQFQEEMRRQSAAAESQP